MPEDNHRLIPHWQPRETASQLLKIPSYLMLINFSKLFIGALVVILVAVVIVMPIINKDDNGARIILSKLPVSDIIEKPRMINPKFESVDSKNQPYTVKAKEAIQQDVDSVRLIGLEADIALNDGNWIAVKADQGLLQILNKKLLLQGNVHVLTNEGNEFTTSQVLMNLDTGDAWGPAEIKAQSPMGTIHAGSFQISTQYKAIRFSNRVKLVIYPQ